LPLLGVLASLVMGQAAFATTSYPDYAGVSADFTVIQESSSLGDPEPACCFGAPTGVGDSLVFSPSSYTATTSGVSGQDGTGAQLQVLITAKGSAKIEKIILSESGSASLDGPSGTGGTLDQLTMLGFVTVLEVDGEGVSLPDIDFNSFSGSDPGVTFSSSNPDLFDYTFVATGSTILEDWWAKGVIDVASIYPNATKVQLSFDNDLYAYTELAENTAWIRKNSVVIGVIPEPGTFALLGAGLLVLAMRGRSRRV
jgi:hypothetical protein